MSGERRGPKGVLRQAFDLTSSCTEWVSAIRSTTESLWMRMLDVLGQWHWPDLTIANHIIDAGRQDAAGGSIDAVIRHDDYDTLVQREQFLRVVLDRAHDGICVLDASGRTLLANPRMTQLLGHGHDDLLGRPIDEFVEPEVAAKIRDRMSRRRSGISEDYELHARAADGSDLWFAISAAALPAGFSPLAPDGGTVALVADITDRKNFELALHRHTLYDPVSQLPNRVLLGNQLDQLREHYRTAGEHFSYLLCDIDGLKLVNDALGSSRGDQLIHQVAQRILDAARTGDCVARTTGDQFVVLCEGTESFAAQRIAQDLVAGVEGAFPLGGSTVWPSISVGVASTSEVEPDALAAAADAALFRAKRRGRSSVAVFDSAAPVDHHSTLLLLADLRAAISDDALELHYQPIIDVSTNAVVGAEALMRWERPGHGYLSPSVFIPLAEETGLITQLGAWSLRRACQDAVTWPENISVSVNVSPRHLTDPHIVETVSATLAETGLAAERLCAEVTETAVFADVPAAAKHLHALASLGVKISLDDFGTGYSSLAYLRNFTVDSFKIDRSFVAGLGRNTDDSAIVVTLLNLAASLGLTVVAEGIETIDQLAQLRQLGCPRGQGYVWSGAMSAENFAAAVGTTERPWPPMGVNAAREGGGLGASVDPAIRRRILALHRRGTSPAAIAAALNREGIPAPVRGRWHRNTVARFIANMSIGTPPG